MSKENLIQIITNLSANPMAIFLLIAVLVIAGALVYAQVKKDPFDLRTLIQDDNGKLSIHKIGQLVALGISSWGFVYLVLGDKLTESYFGVFMSVWSGSELMNTWISTRNSAPRKE